MVWKGGRPENTDAVVASPAYRRDAAERLAALVAHLEAKFGDRVAGYHPVGQNTGEWFYQDTWLAAAERLRQGRPGGMASLAQGPLSRRCVAAGRVARSGGGLGHGGRPLARRAGPLRPACSATRLPSEA